MRASDVGDDSPMSDSTANELPSDDCRSPLSQLNFSVRTALDGRFFRPVSTNNNNLSDEIASGNITVICVKCDAKAPNKSKAIKVSIKSTSNLYSHVRRNHGQRTAEDFRKALERDHFALANPKQARRTRSRRGSTTYSPQSKFEQLIVDYVINTMIPLQSIDDIAFKKIFDFLHIEKVGLRLFSRRTLGRRIEEQFLRQNLMLKELLRPVTYICTTADIWSGGKRSFLGVTGHWLDEKNERQSAALGCKRFKGRHTYEKIASLLISINQNFDLTTDKIIATVTDNGSNFVKAFRVFGVDVEVAVHDETGADDDGVEEENDNDEESWVSLEDDVADRLPYHLRCGAHTLALTYTSDVMKAINAHPVLKHVHKESLKKCNVLWNMAKRPRTAEIIQDVIGKSLSRPNDTRWNSLHDSLKQIITIRPSMEQLAEALDIQGEQILQEEDFSYLEEYVQCSAPVAKALDLLQGEKTAYYGILLPTLLALTRKLQSCCNSEMQFCGPIADAYLDSIKKRFSNILCFESLDGKNAAMAALSYPKFRNKFFPCVDQQTQGDMLKYFKGLIYEYLAKTAGANAVEMETENIPLKDFYDFGGEIDQPPAPQDDLANKAQSIMETYLSDRDSGLEILEKYPSIHYIFKGKNTPLPSSAHVERLFSYATMNNLPKSSRLSDEKFEQRVILRANASLIRAKLMSH